MVSIDSPFVKFLRRHQQLLSKGMILKRGGVPTSQNPPSPAPGLPDAAARFPLPFRRHAQRAMGFYDLGELAW